MSILNMTDAEKYYHELPKYRKRVMEMQDKINDLTYLVHEIFYRLEDLWTDPGLVNDPEFQVMYKNVVQKVLKV